MRGDANQQATMLTAITPDAKVPLDHPIRAIEHHVHIAHCHAKQKELRHPCPIPGRLARDKAEADALDPLVHERKREIAAATVGLLLGFILGVVATLATIVSLNLAYRPHPTSEQPIER